MVVVRQAVGADHGVRIGQDAADVALVHREVDGAGGLQALDRGQRGRTPQSFAMSARSRPVCSGAPFDQVTKIAGERMRNLGSRTVEAAM